jgi:hypothetical protein
VRLGVRRKDVESKFDEVGRGQNGLSVVAHDGDEVHDEDELQVNVRYVVPVVIRVKNIGVR